MAHRGLIRRSLALVGAAALALLATGCGGSSTEEVGVGAGGSVVGPAEGETPPVDAEEAPVAEESNESLPNALSCIANGSGSAGFGMVDATSPGPFETADAAARAIIQGLFTEAPRLPDILSVPASPDNAADGYRLDEGGLAYRVDGEDIMRISIDRYPAGGYGVTGWEFCAAAIDTGTFAFDPSVTEFNR